MGEVRHVLPSGGRGRAHVLKKKGEVAGRGGGGGGGVGGGYHGGGGGGGVGEPGTGIIYACCLRAIRCMHTYCCVFVHVSHEVCTTMRFVQLFRLN